MSGQTMTSQSARIAKWKGEILKHAIPQEVFGRIGKSIKKLGIPPNQSDTGVWRRWLPKGATANTPNTWDVQVADHLLVEGETPAAEQIIAQDITVQLQEYGVLYRFSNRVADMYEDDVPGEMKRIAGERMGLLMEMIRYGVLKGGTNRYLANNVASRSLINGLVSGNQLRNVARGLFKNLAVKITDVLAPSPNIGTQPIEAAYVVVCSGDLEADLRSQLTGFVHVSEYGSRKPIHENELGSWEQFRFVTSPHTGPYLNAGTTTTANTRLAGGVPNSTGAELVDVYPMIVMTEECYGDVMLRGKQALNKVSMIPANQQTKDDPLGQRGYVGASGYAAAVRLNELQMAVVEVAASSL